MQRNKPKDCRTCRYRGRWGRPVNDHRKAVCMRKISHLPVVVTIRHDLIDLDLATGTCQPKSCRAWEARPAPLPNITMGLVQRARARLWELLEESDGKVCIWFTNERGLDSWDWAVITRQDEEFWLESFDTKEEACQFCAEQLLKVDEIWKDEVVDE